MKRSESNKKIYDLLNSEIYNEKNLDLPDISISLIDEDYRNIAGLSDIMIHCRNTQIVSNPGLVFDIKNDIEYHKIEIQCTKKSIWNYDQIVVYNYKNCNYSVPLKN